MPRPSSFTQPLWLSFSEAVLAHLVGKRARWQKFDSALYGVIRYNYHPGLFIKLSISQHRPAVELVYCQFIVSI